jgi:hypothetical protein
MAKSKQAGPTGAAGSTLGAARTKKNAQPKLASTKASKSKAAAGARPGTPASKKVVARKSSAPLSGKTWSDRREGIARRLREIRQDLFGKSGGPEVARQLGLPARTWYGYETGATVPAEVLLALIELTGANPMYVLFGKEPKYPHRLEP